jgi:hypothetical protein
MSKAAFSALVILATIVCSDKGLAQKPIEIFPKDPFLPSEPGLKGTTGSAETSLYKLYDGRTWKSLESEGGGTIEGAATDQIIVQKSLEYLVSGAERDIINAGPSGNTLTQYQSKIEASVESKATESGKPPWFTFTFPKCDLEITREFSVAGGVVKFNKVNLCVVFGGVGGLAYTLYHCDHDAVGRREPVGGGADARSFRTPQDAIADRSAREALQLQPHAEGNAPPPGSGFSTCVDNAFKQAVQGVWKTLTELKE